MTLPIIVLSLVTLQRFAELALASRNTRALKVRGAYERGASHYPVMVAMHASWLIGLWILAWDRPIGLTWLSVFLVLQMLRIWILATLRGRWTTRIIVLPNAPLIRHGPYRFFSHPNYMVVVAEIAILPLAFGLTGYAALFTVLNAAVLWVRLRAETRALREAEGAAQG